MIMKNSFPSSSSSEASWEERAFAEDINVHAAHGSLGGCVWPPKSYFCTFCMREFTSAQALGGHMNIHRRDRARLKLFYADNRANLTRKFCLRGRNTQPQVVPSARVSLHASYLAQCTRRDRPTQRAIVDGDSNCGVETDLYVGLNNENPVAACHFSKPYHLGSEVSSYEVDHIRSNAVDDLDLELRLGRDPKIIT